MKRLLIYTFFLLPIIIAGLSTLTGGCGKNDSKEYEMRGEPDFVINVEGIGQAVGGSAEYRIVEPVEDIDIEFNELILMGYFHSNTEKDQPDYIAFSIYLPTPEYPFNRTYKLGDQTEKNSVNSGGAQIEGIYYSSISGYITLYAEKKDKISGNFEMHVIRDDSKSKESPITLKGNMKGSWSLVCSKLVTSSDIEAAIENGEAVAIPEDNSPCWTIDFEMSSPFCSQFKNMRPSQ